MTEATATKTVDLDMLLCDIEELNGRMLNALVDRGVRTLRQLASMRQCDISRMKLPASGSGTAESGPQVRHKVLFPTEQVKQKALAVGDVVMLKTGHSPEMVIEHLADQIAGCSWFEHIDGRWRKQFCDLHVETLQTERTK